MNSRRPAVMVIAVLAAAFLAVVPRVDWLRLSLSTLRVLPAAHSDNTDFAGSDPYLPLSHRAGEAAETCPATMTQLDRLAGNLTTQSVERLKEFVYLSCDSDENLVRRFQSQVAAGPAPNPLEVLSISAAMDRIGMVDQALELRRRAPDSSIWYVERGRIAIEREQDEPRAFQYFELAENIAPGYDARKISMYMYLCLAAVRDGKVRVVQTPCEDFDRADQSLTSAVLLGRFYYNHGAYEQALHQMTRAVEMDAGSGDAYFWLGRTQAAIGDKVSALRTFERGIQNASLYPWNYLELARIQADSGCYKAARNALQIMQSLPGEGVAQASQALFQELRGKQDDCQIELSLRPDLLRWHTRQRDAVVCRCQSVSERLLTAFAQTKRSEDKA